MASRNVYEFGDFRLDPARRRVQRLDGQPVALRTNGKAFDALVYLVEHAGEPLSRKTLLSALWPDSVVEENSLTQLISVLRRAIGPGYIVTLPGRGYQFVRYVRDIGNVSDVGEVPRIGHVEDVRRDGDVRRIGSASYIGNRRDAPSQRAGASIGAMLAGALAWSTRRVRLLLTGVARIRRP